MNLHVSLVPPGQLMYWIPKLIPYLTKSQAWTKGRANVDDIARFLLVGQMNLWVVLDDDFKGYGYVISEIKSYPQLKMLVLQYCAGEDNHMKLVEQEMYGKLERFARDADCDGMEFMGRLGWRNIGRRYGYKAETVVYEKFFKAVQ